jgi:asparagine synthase (glutamine-hydrolysing)
MSALTGVCYWDGRPVSDSQLAAMSAQSRAAGPDGCGTVQPRPGLALQTDLLHFDRHSASETQPLRFGQGSVVTWDGRLDNRDDLILRLHRDLDSRTPSDAALVGAAYARWGEDALSQLIGDWSLALWDAPRQQIVLARDCMGNRPLYYLERPGLLAWATCLDALIDGFDLTSTPNVEYIAGKFTFGVQHGVTPFENVFLLHGGHALKATAAHRRCQRYFVFVPRTIRYSHVEDYAEQTRALLTEAVRGRLRSTRTVWSHLSGGWDSSSIVCVAQRLIQRGAVEAPDFQTVSLIINDSPETHEKDYLEAVQRWCGLQTHIVEPPPPRAFADLLGHRRPIGWFSKALCEAPLRAHGDHVVMTGLMGDTLMSYGGRAGLSMLEDLYRGHPIRFLKQTLRRSHSRNHPLLRTLASMMHEAWLAPGGASYEAAHRRKQIADRARQWGVSPRDLPAVFGITPHLWAQASPPTQIDCPRSDEFSPFHRPLLQAVYAYGYGSVQSSDLEADIWWTNPYSHRPLVEFILACPRQVFWEPTFNRAGMRRALADILPPELLARNGKGNAAASHDRTFTKRLDQIVEARPLMGPVREWELVTRGYVDPKPLTRLVSKPQGILPNDLDAKFLFHCLEYEAWLRTLKSSARLRPGVVHQSPIHVASRAALTGIAQSEAV